MRKVFHPSSPHAVGNFTNSPAIGAQLGEGGANFGFYSYLTDMETHQRGLQPREMFDPVRMQPVVHQGIKVGDSFEVAVFLFGLILIFCVLLLGCFILSWLPKADTPVQTSVPVYFGQPNARRYLDY